MTTLEDDVGTLYVLRNRDFSLAKIGLTRSGTPDTRADNYARQHGIVWCVYWYAATCHVAEAEARAHHVLQDQRFSHVPGAREIFHVTPEKAKRVAERFVTAPRGAPQSKAKAVRSNWPAYGDILWAVASLLGARSRGSRLAAVARPTLGSRQLHRWLRVLFRAARNQSRSARRT